MIGGVSAQVHGLGNNSRMRQFCWVGLVLLFFGHHIACTAGKVVWSSVEDFVEEQSDLIRDLAEAVEERIQEVESNPNDRNCGCAYHDCGVFFEGQGTCFDMEVPLNENNCPRDKGNCTPTLLFPNFSFVQVPPQVKPDDLEEHRLEKHAAILNDICILEGLEKEGNPGPYARAKKQDPSSGWAFAGSINGVFWLWPGRVRNTEEPGKKSECPAYDPRLRSWYYPTISPPKALIFIVDIAVFSEADTTIHTHLLTLGSKDLVSIIPFNSSMPTHANIQNINEQEYRLWNASAANVENSIESNKRPPVVDVKSAFSLAFNLTGDGFDSLDKFFVLISGSTLDSNKRKELLKAVEKWQPAKNWAIILSYTMASRIYGTEPDRDLAKSIACQNRGVWTDIGDPDEPDLSSYLFLLALPYEFQPTLQASAFFSPVYDAATYLGDAVSVSMGYHRTCDARSPGPQRVLLGVVGSTTRVSDIKSPIEEYEEFQQNQELKGMSIRNVGVDLECQLQWIRKRSNSQCSGGSACTGHNKCRERENVVYDKEQHVFCNWVQEPDPQMHTNSSFCCSQAESNNVCEIHVETNDTEPSRSRHLATALLVVANLAFVFVRAM